MHSISTGMPIGSDPMPTALRALREEWPGIEVVLADTGEDPRLVEWLAQGRLDLHSKRGEADLAALAIEHGARVVSFDHDFSRYPQLRWETPSQP